jgi:drug/metabolite transporter (DMT)-like permease
MKNKAGKILGFILGTAGFLLLFKVIVLDNTPPEDELAPGLVVMAAILCGVFFGFIGHIVQNRFGKKSG